jgi:Holliday junction resolvase RusA-like endonuclease
MIPEKIIIILPLPNKSLHPNFTVGSFGGRMMVAASRKKWKKLTIEAIENEQLETLPWEIIKVRPIFFYSVNRRRDSDNMLGSLKAVYDGIVDSGIIPDDDVAHMIREIPKSKIDKENPRVEIIIERVK